MTKFKDVPEHYRQWIDDFCSNWDLKIDYTTVEFLKTKEVWATYAAWNWHGTVWFDRETKTFCCRVMRFSAHIDTVEADTPEELVKQCCSKYGHD